MTANKDICFICFQSVAHTVSRAWQPHAQRHAQLETAGHGGHGLWSHDRSPLQSSRKDAAPQPFKENSQSSAEPSSSPEMAQAQAVRYPSPMLSRLLQTALDSGHFPEA